MWQHHLSPKNNRRLKWDHRYLVAAVCCKSRWNGRRPLLPRSSGRNWGGEREQSHSGDSPKLLNRPMMVVKDDRWSHWCLFERKVSCSSSQERPGQLCPHSLWTPSSWWLLGLHMCGGLPVCNAYSPHPLPLHLPSQCTPDVQYRGTGTLTRRVWLQWVESVQLGTEIL